MAGTAEDPRSGPVGARNEVALVGLPRSHDYSTLDESGDQSPAFDLPSEDLALPTDVPEDTEPSPDLPADDIHSSDGDDMDFGFPTDLPDTPPPDLSELPDSPTGDLAGDGPLVPDAPQEDAPSAPGPSWSSSHGMVPRTSLARAV